MERLTEPTNDYNDYKTTSKTQLFFGKDYKAAEKVWKPL